MLAAQASFYFTFNDFIGPVYPTLRPRTISKLILWELGESENLTNWGGEQWDVPYSKQKMHIKTCVLILNFPKIHFLLHIFSSLVVFK